MARLFRPLFGASQREPEGSLQLLQAINELSTELRQGFAPAARVCAEATRTVLGAEAVAVTGEERILATAGHPPPWSAAVEEHTQAVLERRRGTRPTVYEISFEQGHRSVAVSVIVLGDVPVGTIHVLSPHQTDLRLKEQSELARLVSTQLELAELEQSRAYAAEAELKALRAQISPHFLQNSLTAIAGLINSDPARARELVATFAGFLRASFRTPTDLTPLSEELRLVEAYLELENTRFSGRFEVKLNIAPEALSVRLPFLSVQPLVENAIRHGLETRAGPGRLTIAAQDAGPEIVITIEDDGVGIDPDQLQRAIDGSEATPHVGIMAVDTRLRKTFGPDYGLVITTAAGAGTEVSMRLPKRGPR
jgi:two-component system LytT family sensor kinase